MRRDLLRKYLKKFPYSYCQEAGFDAFSTCRVLKIKCPYCINNVDCKEKEDGLEYYRQLVFGLDMSPRKARKLTLIFIETLPTVVKIVRGFMG